MIRLFSCFHVQTKLLITAAACELWGCFESNVFHCLHNSPLCVYEGHTGTISLVFWVVTICSMFVCSHQDYDDKKQLHYREPPPQPLSSSSRHRSHKHYHDDPEYLDDSKPMGRSEKRSSLPTPLPPPPPSWKSRDLADRLSPTGKDILSKPFMGHEDKLSKLSRGSVSSEGGGGGGGRVGSGVGKTKRTTPPEKRSSPPQEGGTESEGEAGEEDTRRKRPRTEKRYIGRIWTCHNMPTRQDIPYMDHRAVPKTNDV